MYIRVNAHLDSTFWGIASLLPHIVPIPFEEVRSTRKKEGKKNQKSQQNKLKEVFTNQNC